MPKMTNEQKAETRKACLAKGIATRNMTGLEMYRHAVEFGIVSKGNNTAAAAPEKVVELPKKDKSITKAGSKLEEALRELMPEGELDEARVIELIHQYSAAPKVVDVRVTKNDEVKVIEGSHNLVPELLMNISAGVPTCLVGPAGSGKTTACQQVADSLGLEFYFSGAVTQEHKLLGYMDANKQYHRTPYREAFENGGLFLLDEVDGSSPNAIMGPLHAAAANGLCDFPDGIVKAHPDFILVAAANTFGTGANRQYVGRNQLDAATLDRFAFIEWGYDEALEQRCALAEWEGAGSWVKKVQGFRAKIEKAGLRHVVSPRASIMGAKLLKAGMDEQKVTAMLIHKGMTVDQIKQVS